jgi:hypothetical protein
MQLNLNKLSQGNYQGGPPTAISVPQGRDSCRSNISVVSNSRFYKVVRQEHENPPNVSIARSPSFKALFLFFKDFLLTLL